MRFPQTLAGYAKKWRLQFLFGKELNGVDYYPPKESVHHCRQTLQKILFDNIIKYWYPQVLDTENGGYKAPQVLSFNRIERANKSLVAQARTLWFFSRLANFRYDNGCYISAAKHGYEFLRTRLWDNSFGGFFWEIDCSGDRIIHADKHLYGQAFALYALSEYAVAAGESSAVDLAHNLFGLFEAYAHDAKFGGFRESFRRDWTPVPTDRKSYLGAHGHIKLMNTHLHLLEAMIAHDRMAKTAVVRDRLIELILVNSNAMVRKKSCSCGEAYLPNWEPLRGTANERVSYGHDVENIWLLVEACRSVNMSGYLLVDLFRSLFDNSLVYGFDRKRGGFYESGVLDKHADRKDKLYWVQAEGLIGALQLYLLTREKLYWSCFARTLEWIDRYQANWRSGEWHIRVSNDGVPIQSGSYAWSSPYHQGRAMLKCLKLIDRI